MQQIWPCRQIHKTAITGGENVWLDIICQKLHTQEIYFSLRKKREDATDSARLEIIPSNILFHMSSLNSYIWNWFCNGCLPSLAIMKLWLFYHTVKVYTYFSAHSREGSNLKIGLCCGIGRDGQGRVLENSWHQKK